MFVLRRVYFVRRVEVPLLRIGGSKMKHPVKPTHHEGKERRPNSWKEPVGWRPSASRDGDRGNETDEEAYVMNAGG